MEIRLRLALGRLNRRGLSLIPVPFSRASLVSRIPAVIYLFLSFLVLIRNPKPE